MGRSLLRRRGPDDATVRPFTDSTDLLADPSALRKRFEADGYVLVRGVADIDQLTRLHAEIASIVGDAGWLAADTPELELEAGPNRYIEGDPKYFEVYDAVQRLEAFHAVPHQEGVIGLMRALLGDTAFPHPLAVCRLVFPNYDASQTPPHQDHPNNQGTEDLLACWIPLTDCPNELGGLSVLSGSHRFGVLPLEFSLGPGNRRARLDGRHRDLEWVGGEMALGDALVFHSLTVHRARRNVSDQLRVSVDYRFQREQEPLTERCLEPHFGRLSWEEIYAGWDAPELQYYWRDLDFSVTPFDDAYHQMSGFALRRAKRIYQREERRRQQV